MTSNQKVYAHKMQLFQDLNTHLGTNIDIVKSLNTAKYYFFLDNGELYTATNFTQMLHNLNDVFDLGIATNVSYEGRNMLVIFEDFEGKSQVSEKNKEERNYSDAEWLSENLTVEDLKKYFGDKGIEVPTKYMKKEDLISYFLSKSVDTSESTQKEAVETVELKKEDIKTEDLKREEEKLVIENNGEQLPKED